MYLLYCDESNLMETNNQFFIYGGLAIATEMALSLSQEIDDIRKKANIRKDFHLKFNPAPPNLTHNDFIKVKQAILESVVKHKCNLFASLILHNISKSPDEARRKEINRVCYHFNCFLLRNQTHGLVLIDRFNDKQIDGHLREKFSKGLLGLPYSKQMRLNNIVGFHYSAIGQSHFASLVDIVIGSLRFAVNAFTSKNESRISSSAKLLGLLAPLFYRPDKGKAVSEISLFFSPKVIKVPEYKQRYEELKQFLCDNSIETEQNISNERCY